MSMGNRPVVHTRMHNVARATHSAFNCAKACTITFVGCCHREIMIRSAHQLLARVTLSTQPFIRSRQQPQEKPSCNARAELLRIANAIVAVRPMATRAVLLVWLRWRNTWASRSSW